MNFSNHNIFKKLRGSESHAIINLLSGNADILSPEKAREIKNRSYTDISEYTEKGYLTDEATETRLYKNVYLDFIDKREASEVQIFFVPWYTCNFSCSYCYQSGYENEVAIPGPEVIDAFFDYVRKEFGAKNKYITLFGGEPLLPGKKHEETISYFMTKARESKLDVAIVTNGYSIPQYIKHFEHVNIREIQVTLDGTEEVHNGRRALKSGGGTFVEVASGIDMILAAGINVNLRVVIDADNMDNMSALAAFAIEKGWTSNRLFKTQPGRNYELHFCMKEHARLFDRLEMYERIYDMSVAHPEVRELFSPSFSVTKHLFENGKLPGPLFDSCPACKTEWAFDYTGSIFPCTATVGKADEKIGAFYPAIAKDADRVRLWEDRDVTTIAGCAGCSLRLACGGGCGSVAKNKTGSISSPDCRPVAELIGMGIPYYFSTDIKETAK